MLFAHLTQVKLGMDNSLGIKPNAKVRTVSIAKQHIAFDAVKEMVATVAFQRLSMRKYRVPDTRLVRSPIINHVTGENLMTRYVLEHINEGRKETEKISDSVHFCSRFVAKSCSLEDALESILSCKHNLQDADGLPQLVRPQGRAHVGRSS